MTDAHYRTIVGADRRNAQSRNWKQHTILWLRLVYACLAWVSHLPRWCAIMCHTVMCWVWVGVGESGSGKGGKAPVYHCIIRSKYTCCWSFSCFYFSALDCPSLCCWWRVTSMHNRALLLHRKKTTSKDEERRISFSPYFALCTYHMAFCTWKSSTK